MPATRPRISIVEDDPEIRRLLLARLEKEEFRAEAADGGAAFDRLVVARGYPDLVVLDVMLPGEDGFAICRRIRASSPVSIPPLSRFHETHFKITASSSSQAGRGTACASG